MNILCALWGFLALAWSICAISSWMAVFAHAKYCGCTWRESHPADALYWTAAAAVAFIAAAITA
jgi:hypothetical protein